MAFNDDVILHSDLTDQQIKDVAVRVNMDAKKEDAFSKYFESRIWPKGKIAVQFRTLIHKPLTASEADGFTLLEVVAPTGRELSYATFSFGTKDYGTKYRYTWKDVAYNADDVVRDASSELTQWVVEERNILLGKALLASKSTISFGESETILGITKKVEMTFRKMHCKPLWGTSFDCLTTSEIIDLLTEEYVSKNNGQAIPEMDKSKAMEGYITSYKHIDFRDPACDEVLIDSTASTGGHYMIFVARTPTGAMPAVKYQLAGDGVEIIHNPLGSGLLQDSAGNYTSDDNKQMGSIACNIKGFIGQIIDDRAVIVVKVPTTKATSNYVYSSVAENVKDTLTKVVNAKGTNKTTSKSPK